MECPGLRALVAPAPLASRDSGEDSLLPIAAHGCLSMSESLTRILSPHSLAGSFWCLRFLPLGEESGDLIADLQALQGA